MCGFRALVTLEALCCRQPCVPAPVLSKFICIPVFNCGILQVTCADLFHSDQK